MGSRSKQSREYSGPKIIMVMILLALVWGALWARAGYLQLYKGKELAGLASRQSFAAEHEQGRRGRILDRNGNVLATSVETMSVYLRPFEAKGTPNLARTLGSILDIHPAKIERKLASRSGFVWVERQISDKAAKAIRDADLPGVYMTPEYNRYYPNSQLAGQLVGFVGVDGKGLEGVERWFNDRLSPSKARYVVQRDAAGRRLYLDASGREVDVDGKDVRLTIDTHIQGAAETALYQTVRMFDASSASAVVADVKTGEILALANYPFFNPNAFRTTPAAHRRHRAITDVFEPGSTMKPFVFAAAMDMGVLKPGDLIDCENGRWRVARHTVRDTHPHRWLPVNKVLAYSSNIGSGKIGLSVGVDAYYKYLIGLGFGQKPGTGLPGEGRGLLRPAPQWTKMDLVAGAFGQGVGVTALQMAKAYIALADGGLRKPLKVALAPEVINEEPLRVFSEETARTVLSMMQEVVEDDGTGRKVRIPGVPMAGKTGTAQKASPQGGYGDQYVSGFVGMVPAEAPELLVIVTVDSPQKAHYGSTVAAPAVRQIIVDTLAYQGKLPENPVTQAAVQELENTPQPGCSLVSINGKAVAPPPDCGERVPDVAGMPVRRAMEILIRKGVVPVIKGRGMTVSKQEPVAGQPWPKGDEGDVFVLWVS